MSSLNLVSWRCLAHDPAFLGLPGANQIADNDQLGRDAYAHLERFLDGQLADRFDERQPCPNRALGIVLARLRIAEIHRHAVAQVFGLGAEFIRTHLAALAATDFFTVEVLTLRGVVTYYVLFFIHLDSRRVPRKSRRVTVGVTYLNMQILALVPAKRMQIDHEPARWVLVCLAAR